MPRFGETIDLYLQLSDGDALQYVRAVLRDPIGNVLQTLDLNNVGGGLYLSQAASMPGFRTVYATYSVYSDAGYTTLNTAYPITTQAIALVSASDVTLVGTVDGSSIGFVPVVQGEDRTLNIKLMERSMPGVPGDPVDLSGVTAISAVFLNADGTKLTKTLTNGVVVLSPLLGTMQVGLLDTETVNLKLGERQNFELQIAFGATIRIVQFLNALTVVVKLG